MRNYGVGKTIIYRNETEHRHFAYDVPVFCLISFGFI